MHRKLLFNQVTERSLSGAWLAQIRWRFCSKGGLPQEGAALLVFGQSYTRRTISFINLIGRKMLGLWVKTNFISENLAQIPVLSHVLFCALVFAGRSSQVPLIGSSRALRERWCTGIINSARPRRGTWYGACPQELQNESKQTFSSFFLAIIYKLQQLRNHCPTIVIAFISL